MIDRAEVTLASFGADRDWLLRFCPPETRSALTALFEIEHGVMDSLRPGLEHSVAHARLEWWSDELTRLAQGTPRHPATRLLAASALDRGTSPPDLHALVEHVRVDLACVAFISRAELDQHLDAWGQSLFRTAARLSIDADPDPKSQAHARLAAERLSVQAGRLVRESELLRRFSRHALSGRIYVPLGDPPVTPSHWTARPLGPIESEALAARRREISQSLKQMAAATSPVERPALRVPMLWMAFAVTPSGLDSALLSPLRRTIATWRGAVALSRGRVPSELI